MDKLLNLSNGKTVLTADYIIAKTLDLRESGYTHLTEAEVAEQLDKILNGENLSVIGEFMKDDIRMV